MMLVKSYYLAVPCSVSEQSMYCCVQLNFHFEVSFFPKHIIGDFREHWSAIGGREEHISLMESIKNRETFGSCHTYRLTKECRGLFLPTDFREMRPTSLPACHGYCPSQRFGLNDLSSLSWLCDQLPWTKTWCPVPRQGIKYLWVSFSSDDLISLYI